MTRWLPQWFGWNPRPQPRHRRSASLRVEQLEDRRVAAIVVDTLADGQFAFLTSLREAIDAANVNTDPDVITFAPGLFTPGVNSPIQLLSELPVLATNIDIQGPGANLLTVRRNTGGDYRIFTVATNTTVTLSGLTIANGKISGAAAQGGGILNGGTLTVSNSILTVNQATGGAGGGIFNSGQLTLINSTLFDNNAAYGGGIVNLNRLEVRNSTLFVNLATSSHGGGIYNNGQLQLTNSTLSSNSAIVDGGGIFSNGFETLTNVTLTRNSADAAENGPGRGGGIHRVGGTLTLHNTIVAGNFKGGGTNRDDIFGEVEDASSFNLIGDGAGIPPGSIEHNTNGNLIGVNRFDQAPIEPRLGPLQDNGGPTFTHALRSDSPAINRGLGPGAGAVDQRGIGRVGAPDIGAFEFIPLAVPARTIVAALVNKKVRTTRRLFVRVSFADTGALKVEIRSPFQRPGHRAIAVAVLDSNGDGVADAVQITAFKSRPRKGMVVKTLFV